MLMITIIKNCEVTVMEDEWMEGEVNNKINEDNFVVKKEVTPGVC